MVFKCKMCGGNIEYEKGKTVGTCSFCGTTQTFPKLDDDQRANLYDRANHYRRCNDFDKAESIYEMILNEDGTDAEAYWSLVLCKYGIEYVEDSLTHKRVPTVNRTQFTPVFADEDFKSALKNADDKQKEIYLNEAKVIDEIQKSIIEISKKEKPFDVFICYKETDETGKRTQDSVLGNDLYHQLTTEGFKVFYSRITLEDKLGQAYEPYIFAALNSAKVMVVLGTKPEYFKAAWVKNEWSRYLTLVKASGGKKMLIPAYRDMDPYDLPEEFSHLQAQDMSKLGFMQDIIHGIRKLIAIDGNQATGNGQLGDSAISGNTEPLLRRAFMFLEDKDWEKADNYCEQVLNREPENGKAYLGKLLAAVNVDSIEKLPQCGKVLSNYNSYKNFLRFGDQSVGKQLIEINQRLQEEAEVKSELKQLEQEESKIKFSVDQAKAAFNNLQEKLKKVKSSRLPLICIISLISHIICFVFLRYLGDSDYVAQVIVFSVAAIVSLVMVGIIRTNLGQNGFIMILLDIFTFGLAGTIFSLVELICQSVHKSKHKKKYGQEIKEAEESIIKAQTKLIDCEEKIEAVRNHLTDLKNNPYVFQQ